VRDRGVLLVMVLGNAVARVGCCDLSHPLLRDGSAGGVMMVVALPVLVAL
jgi:hypothetical protein